MRFKKHLGWWGALAVFFSSCSASARASGPATGNYSIVTTASLVSQYLLRGQRLSGAAMQPTVEYDAGNLALGVWANFPIQRVANVSDPELNLYGFYTATVDPSFTVVPGFIVYVYPNAPTDAGFYRSTFEPNLAVNYTFKGVRCTPKIYYDVALRGLTSEFSVAYAWPLRELGTELDLTATAGGYLQRHAANGNGPRAKAWGDYWLLGFATPLQLTRVSKLTLGWSYMKGSNAYTKIGMAGRTTNPLEAGRGVLSASYSATF